MRIEFFFKAQSELSALVNFMMAYQQSSSPHLLSKLPSVLPTQSIFHRFNLANKVKNDNLLESAKNIMKVMPSANVCAHYSLKYNSVKSVDLSFTKFEKFLSDAEAIGVSEVMVISGSGDKKALNTVTCLEMLSRSDSHAARNIDIGIAYNPYFPDSKNKTLEIDRLASKLSTGMVQTIYLQFGSDTALLREGVQVIKNALAKHYKEFEGKSRGGCKNIKVVGSIMIPSKVLLARMKFRPWNGVFLSDLFLGDVSDAEMIVREILDIYSKNDVEVLVETAFKKDSEAEHILALLSMKNSLPDGVVIGNKIDGEKQSPVLVSAVQSDQKKRKNFL